MKTAIFTRAHEITRRSREWSQAHGEQFNYAWEFRFALNHAWNEAKDEPGYVDFMTIAHAITRAAIQPGDDYRVTFAAALRIAYAEYAASAAAEWAAKTPEEQYNALLAMAWYEYGQRDARIDRRTGEALPNVFTWVNPAAPADDIRAVAHEAYIRLIGYLDDPRRAELPLSRLMSRAVIISAQKISRAERRNPTAERAPNPEAGAIIVDSIERASKDDIDRAIIAALAAGYSAREIGQRLGMSHTAINKRVRAIRDRYAAEA